MLIVAQVELKTVLGEARTRTCTKNSIQSPIRQLCYGGRRGKHAHWISRHCVWIRQGDFVGVWLLHQAGTKQVIGQLKAMFEATMPKSGPEPDAAELLANPSMLVETEPAEVCRGVDRIWVAAVCRHLLFTLRVVSDG